MPAVPASESESEPWDAAFVVAQPAERIAAPVMMEESGPELAAPSPIAPPVTTPIASPLVAAVPTPEPSREPVAEDKVMPLPPTEDVAQAEPAEAGTASTDTQPAEAGTANTEPTSAGTASATDETALLARTVTPSPAAQVARPEDVRRDLEYPDTGLQPARPVAPEPAPQQIEQPKVQEPARPEPPKRAEEPKSPPTWVQPETLLAGLDELTSHMGTRRWAAEASSLVRRLGPAMITGAPETASLVQRLEELGGQAPRMMVSLRDKRLAAKLSRVQLALDRRLSVWKQLAELGGMAKASTPAPQVDVEAMSVCLSELDTLTRGSDEGRAWRNYLLVDALREWSAKRQPAEDRVPRELSQQLLKRLDQAQFSPRQRQFITTGPVAKLHSELLRHSAEPVDAGRLLCHLEQYERTGLPSDGRLLAEDCRHLALAADKAHRQLGHRVEMHYRNANLRVAISEELINRMVPKRDLEYAPVYDTIQGVPVRGQSLAATDLAIRLIPDPQRVRLALEVSGEVATLTSSTSGPATFVSDGEAVYVARKPLEVDLKGIRLWATEVEVDCDTRLRRVRTDFSGLPILGPVAHNIAKNQYEQRLPMADAEVREKIAAKARERLDKESSAQLTLAARKLHEKVLAPMDALALDPTMVAAETTKERFVMRIRLAGGDQLGSHTPRPQAPANSLASAQIHESVLNNVIQHLDLDGQTFTLPQLDKHIARRLSRPEPTQRNEETEDVTITFASRDAIHVRCADGKMEVTLSVAKLSKAPRKWKEFQVRAYYRPVVRGRSVEFARDGVVQLIGRLSTGSQLALRGVFARVFPEAPAWKVTPETFINHPKLADLAFTQFAMDDGWIGVALAPAPRRAAGRQGLLRR